MYNKAFWEFVKTYLKRTHVDTTIKPCVFVREHPELIKQEYSKLKKSLTAGTRRIPLPSECDAPFSDQARREQRAYRSGDDSS